jgi:methyltransferase (TIGR00027 family)
METVSLTAYAIATIRANEAARPPSERLFDDALAPIFAADGSAAAEGTKRFLELPFLSDGVRLRTRFNDEFVTDAVARGLRQIVMMGAGFDARAWRLPAIAAHGARVFEIDLPPVVARKRALLERAQIACPSGFSWITSDFSDEAFAGTLARDLEHAGFRAGAGAAFVWEGVIAYLTRDAIDRTLRFMAEQGGRGSRLTFECAADAFAPATASDVVRAAGFTGAEETSYSALWERWLPGPAHENAALVRAVVASRT